MGTNIRPEVSAKNEYYISKHRYYELKHFCMQYKEFKKIYDELCGDMQTGMIKIENRDGAGKPDESMYVRERYLDKINLIEECSKLTDTVIGPYILKGVTEGLSYEYLRMNSNVPCCKDVYYHLYRKFFYILNYRKDCA